MARNSNATVCANLKKRLEELGMSITALAAKTGYTQPRMHRIVSGTQKMTLDDLDAISLALHMSADELLMGEKSLLGTEHPLPLIEELSALRYRSTDEHDVMLRCAPDHLRRMSIFDPDEYEITGYLGKQKGYPEIRIVKKSDHCGAYIQLALDSDYLVASVRIGFDRKYEDAYAMKSRVDFYADDSLARSVEKFEKVQFAEYRLDQNTFASDLSVARMLREAKKAYLRLIKICGKRGIAETAFFMNFKQRGCVFVSDKVMLPEIADAFFSDRKPEQRRPAFCLDSDNHIVYAVSPVNLKSFHRTESHGWFYLIPLSAQGRFYNGLDTPENIVSVTPLEAFILGEQGPEEEKRNVLMKLHENACEGLEKAGIGITLNELFEIYNVNNSQ